MVKEYDDAHSIPPCSTPKSTPKWTWSQNVQERAADSREPPVKEVSLRQPEDFAHQLSEQLCPRAGRFEWLRVGHWRKNLRREEARLIA